MNFRIFQIDILYLIHDNRDIGIMKLKIKNKKIHGIQPNFTDFIIRLNDLIMACKPRTVRRYLVRLFMICSLVSPGTSCSRVEGCDPSVTREMILIVRS